MAETNAVTWLQEIIADAEKDELLFPVVNVLNLKWVLAELSQLTAENAELRVDKEDNDDFMAYMVGELAKWDCGRKDCDHTAVPPMMWPELIAEIVGVAVAKETAALKEGIALLAVAVFGERPPRDLDCTRIANGVLEIKSQLSQLTADRDRLREDLEAMKESAARPANWRPGIWRIERTYVGYDASFLSDSEDAMRWAETHATRNPEAHAQLAAWQAALSPTVKDR